MKTTSIQKLGALACFLFCFCVALPAQEQHRITVIKKSTLDNGDVQKRIDEVALLDLLNEKNIVTEASRNGNDNHRNPCQVFIGVGTSSVSGGLKVDYTIDDTPARTYGVQTGDVITAIDGVAVGIQSELIQQRDKHQPGEAFTLAILRDGKAMNIEARFKECSEEEMTRYKQRQEALALSMESLNERMKDFNSLSAQYFKEVGAEGFMKMERKERPILGIYEEEGADADGLVVRSVIQGKGAEAAGLQAGDVITNVADQVVTGGGTLRAALAGHKPGEQITVVYQRDGQSTQTLLTLSADHNYYAYSVERDPCAVFIGVYTGDWAINGKGVRVTGIVDNTPARESGVQAGDVIISLDGQPVNTNEELRRERDKHKPGDAFRMTLVRDGAEMNIDARFKVCPTTGEEVAPVTQLVERIPEEKPADQRNTPVNTESELPLQSLELYPNPTAGPLNVRFEAEAVPTTVRIMDASGKTVYFNQMNQFSGYFSEQINLNGTAGTYTLSIQQGKKVISRKIVLMPRV